MGAVSIAAGAEAITSPVTTRGVVPTRGPGGGHVPRLTSESIQGINIRTARGRRWAIAAINGGSWAAVMAPSALSTLTTAPAGLTELDGDAESATTSLGARGTPPDWTLLGSVAGAGLSPPGPFPEGEETGAAGNQRASKRRFLSADSNWIDSGSGDRAGSTPT